MSAAPVVVSEIGPPPAVMHVSEPSSERIAAQTREKWLTVFWATAIISLGILMCFLLMNWMCCSA